MASKPIADFTDERGEARDKIYHRSHATLSDRRVIALTLVDLSRHGFMARVETDIAVGEWFTVSLPVIGTVGAAVRWSLGGRIGCQLERPIDANSYPALLAATGG